MRHGLKPSLVCRLGSPITGLVCQPVVGLSLENKGFLGKRKYLMFFLVRCFRRGNLAPLPRATLTQPKPQSTMTTKQALAHPAVLEIERNPGMDDYTVMIYLKDGYVARDGTSTLYGATIREATSGLKHVKEGEPD